MGVTKENRQFKQKIDRKKCRVLTFILALFHRLGAVLETSFEGI